MGSYGMVVKAHKNDRVYALKTLNATESPTEDEIHLFYHEAKLLTETNHAKIPKCIETFSCASNHFMVQEYVVGDTLSSLAIQGYLFSEQEIKEMIYQLLSILCYLHDQQVIVHRDLRLSNLIVNNGQLYLIDFGFARYYQRQEDVLLPDPPSRNPSGSYLALRRELSPHSDLFGAGLVALDLMDNWIHDNSNGNISNPFHNFLKKLLNPHKGFTTAAEALQVLKTLR